MKPIEDNATHNIATGVAMQTVRESFNMRHASLVLPGWLISFTHYAQNSNLESATVESLNERACKIPELLKLFYTHLLPGVV